MAQQATGISLHNFNMQYGQQTLFEGLTVHFAGGQWHSILGSSGIGKSSLLRAIAGLVPSIELYGEIVADDDSPLENRIALMAQDDLLMPWLSVLDNVCLGFRLRKQNTEAVRQQAKHLLTQVGLDGYEQRYPYQLSGGQRQRVALARTLLEDKSIILMDEPFSALDVASRLQLQALFVRLLQGRTVLFITHDPLEALRLSQQLWLMHSYPAQLENIVRLSTPTPRMMDDPALLKWQNQLLKRLQESV